MGSELLGDHGHDENGAEQRRGKGEVAKKPRPPEESPAAACSRSSIGGQTPQTGHGLEPDCE